MTYSGSRETREMRLMSRVIRDSDQTFATSIAELIAKLRLPGQENPPASWDEVMIEVHRITDEVVNQVSLKRWARIYGIPTWDLMEDEYRAQLDEAGIKI